MAKYWIFLLTFYKAHHILYLSLSAFKFSLNSIDYIFSQCPWAACLHYPLHFPSHPLLTLSLSTLDRRIAWSAPAFLVVSNNPISINPDVVLTQPQASVPLLVMAYLGWDSKGAHTKLDYSLQVRHNFFLSSCINLLSLNT